MALTSTVSDPSAYHWTAIQNTNEQIDSGRWKWSIQCIWTIDELWLSHLLLGMHVGQLSPCHILKQETSSTTLCIRIACLNRWFCCIASMWVSKLTVLPMRQRTSRCAVWTVFQIVDRQLFVSEFQCIEGIKNTWFCAIRNSTGSVEESASDIHVCRIRPHSIDSMRCMVFFFSFCTSLLLIANGTNSN